MNAIFLFPAILVCALAGFSRGDVKPAEVTFFYETLCGGCKHFIMKQLLPTYTDKRYNYTSLISKLTLVPYGWVHIKTTHEYICNHGPVECDGNRLHGCAAQHITDEVTTLTYLSCLEDEVKTLEIKKYPIDACQDKLPTGLYQKIMNCYNSDESWEIFKENGKKTNTFFNITSASVPAISSNPQNKLQTGMFKLNGDREVPYVSFNNLHDDDMSNQAYLDFRKTLCQVTGDVDPACSSP